MSIVVTGSGGFLGQRVVARLAGDGHQIIAVDRQDYSGPARKGIAFHQADLKDAGRLLPPSVPEGTPFVLVHLAWDMRRNQGFGIQAGQVQQLADLLDYWENRGLQRVIIMGSAEEYGQRAGRLKESDTPQLPLSPYGWAKRAARDLAESWSLRRGMPVAWLRPFIMYGPGQRGDMVVPYALDCARNQRAAHFSDGQQSRDFVHVDDVVEGLRMILDRKADGFKEFNLGRGEEVRVADVITAIARRYGVEELFQLGAIPRRPNEPEIQIADTTRAAKELGWYARMSWREGLKALMME